MKRFRGKSLRLWVLHIAQRVFIAAGFVLLAYSGATMVYAELYQRYQAWNFEQQLDVRELVKPGFMASDVDVREGDLVGRLDIPRIGISVMVLEGVETETLQVAAGHVPGTALPGDGGNAAVAAHRETFFRKLQGIRVDDSIRVSTLRGTYDYVVDSTEIVGPQDIQVLESQAYQELTLITCYPFYFIGSAPERFIVHARLAKAGL
jgi:sortase A